MKRKKKTLFICERPGILIKIAAYLENDGTVVVLALMRYNDPKYSYIHLDVRRARFQVG